MFKVWIIEDDSGNQFVYRESLASKYNLTIFETLAAFKLALTTDSPDLLIADLRLPDESFLKYLSTQTKAPPAYPMIVVSSMDNLEVCQSCFQHGVHDFITKPFSTNELLAKIEKAKREFYLGPLKFIDLKQGLLTNDNKTIQFTPKEYHILKILSASPNMTLDREQIKNQVWKKLELSGNAVDVHMYSIRKKIKPYQISIEFVEPNFFKIVVLP